MRRKDTAPHIQGMRLSFPLAVALAALLLSGQAGAAGARGCITEEEAGHEAVVRHAVAMREHARACDLRGYTSGLASAWAGIESAHGERMRASHEKREAALRRELADLPGVYAALTAGFVRHHREWPVSAPGCANLADAMRSVGADGWPSFEKAAARWRGQVALDLAICPKRAGISAAPGR